MSHEKYRRLIATAKTLKLVATAVVHPCDESSLAGAIDAAKLALMPAGRAEALMKGSLHADTRSLLAAASMR